MTHPIIYNNCQAIKHPPIPNQSTHLRRGRALGGVPLQELLEEVQRGGGGLGVEPGGCVCFYVWLID